MQGGDGFFKSTFGDALAHGIDELLGEPIFHLLDRRDLGPDDGLSRVALDRLDAVDVASVDEGNGLARAAGATRTADAVDIVFGVLWQLVVEDEIDVVHIDAARGDVGGDENLDGALAEKTQDALAHRLGDVAVKTVSGVAAGEEFLGALINGPFRVAKNDGKARLLEVKKARDELDARALAGLVADLLDRFDGEALALDLDELRILPVALDDAADRGIHRRGEEEGLPFLGESAEEAFHLIGEAHVEHAVGLVEHGDANVGKIQGASLDMVDETTGRAHDDLHPLMQGADLAVDRSASVDRDGAESREPGTEALDLGADLHRELTRRADHEHLRIGIVPVDPGETGEAESGGFSRTGLGETDEILALERERNRGGLDVRGFLVAKQFDGSEERLGQAEGGEGGMIHGKRQVE